MKPSKIEIHNYRKLSEVTINLTNHMNVIFGENATGKSTIIQLIYDAFHCTKYGSILNYDTTSGTALIKIHSDDTVLRSFTRLRDIFNHYLYPLFGVPGFARAAYNTCSFINANLTVRLIKPNSYTPKQYEPFISSIVKEIYPQFNKFINYNLSTGERALYNLINKIHTYTTCAPKNKDLLILIDDIDINLHPKCQMNIIKVLRKYFSDVQFIITSHSPFIFENLEKDEVTQLVQNDNGEVTIAPVPYAKGGGITSIIANYFDVENYNDDFSK